MEMPDLVYKIGLIKIQGIGAVTARNLVSYCGGAKEVFQAKKKELLKIPGIGVNTAALILEQNVLHEAEKEVEWLERNGVKALFYADAEFPNRLKHYNDCPFLLFYKGNADLNHPRTVGIIGTREATAHGKAICEDLVEGLKPYGVHTVSGLAYGIDVIAHRKSVASDIPSIGVMANGMNKLYPADHASIVAKMVECGGILTEHSSNTIAKAEHFPMRNRIVAAMCDALIVVETATKGGSMITANLAFDYNKDIFAVPGRLRDKYSEGCNHLIKTEKARLIEKAADVAYIMRWEEMDAKKVVQQQLFVELTTPEQTILDIIKTSEAMSIDEITYRSQLAHSELAAILLMLEFKGVLCALPGKRYFAV
jgi:DNA processing protein